MELMEDNQVLISAIIPIAGFPNGIEQISRWASNPSLSNFEIILIKDSESKELNLQIDGIAEELRKVTNVSIIKSTSRNPGGSRNLGLENAKGSWITFWDCDDVPNPTKFVEIVYEAQIQGADVALGAFSVKTEHKEKFYSIGGESRHETLESVAMNPGLWRFVFRAELVKNSRFPELRMAEDQMYLASVLSKSKKIFASKEYVYEYWLYQSGQLTKNKKALDDLLIAIKHFEKEYRKHQCQEYLIVFIRLSLTSLMKGNLRSKLTTLFNLTKLGLHDLPRLSLIVRTILKILRTK